jgi:hypothetical protein
LRVRAERNNWRERADHLGQGWHKQKVRNREVLDERNQANMRREMMLDKRRRTLALAQSIRTAKRTARDIADMRWQQVQGYSAECDRLQTLTTAINARALTAETALQAVTARQSGSQPYAMRVAFKRAA